MLREHTSVHQGVQLVQMLRSLLRSQPFLKNREQGTGNRGRGEEVDRKQGIKSQRKSDNL
jgi:hypothetical protein